MYLAVMLINIYDFLASAVIAHKGILALWA